MSGKASRKVKAKQPHEKRPASATGFIPPTYANDIVKSLPQDSDSRLLFSRPGVYSRVLLWLGVLFVSAAIQAVWMYFARYIGRADFWFNVPVGLTMGSDNLVTAILGFIVSSIGYFCPIIALILVVFCKSPWPFRVAACLGVIGLGAELGRAIMNSVFYAQVSAGTTRNYFFGATSFPYKGAEVHSYDAPFLSPWAVVGSLAAVAVAAVYAFVRKGDGSHPRLLWILGLVAPLSLLGLSLGISNVGILSVLLLLFYVGFGFVALSTDVTWTSWLVSMRKDARWQSWAAYCLLLDVIIAFATSFLFLSQAL